MGLLDGDLRAVFGSVFGPLLLDGTIHAVTRTDNGRGGITVTTAPYAVKAMMESYSDLVRAEAGLGTTDVKIIVLQEGVAYTPTVNDEISLRGERWAIAQIDQDPAQASWVMRATPAHVEDEDEDSGS